MPAVGGVVAGYVVLTAIVAAGVATLVARSPALLTGLTVLGALYLLRLGGGWPFAAQIAVLGGVHTVNCAVVYLAVGLAARTVLRARPSIAKAMTRCSGIAMIAIAVVLLAERAVGH